MLRGDAVDRRARLRAARRASSRAARSCSSATWPPGAALTADDLGFKRPGTGIAPFDADRVVGRSLRDGGSAGTVLTEEALV